MSGRPTVAFSMGDPHGIGGEVLLKALKQAPASVSFQPLIFGDPDYLRALDRDLGVGADLSSAEVVRCARFAYPPRWGRLDAQAGAFAVASLRAAVECCRDEGPGVLVTAPLHKEAARLADPSFRQGQTEFVASFFPGSRPAMAFFSDRLRVLLATAHIPLRKVAGAIDREELVRRGLLFHEALSRLSEDPVRVAVCGLNPHASEGGLFGDEEERVVAPAVVELRARLGQEAVAGPFPPDTIFRRVLRADFDGVVALYHDQGLIPLKLVAFETAVNVSLGLPLVRTSPDHGTAFDIAGKNRADPRSMVEAIRWGVRLAEG